MGSARPYAALLALPLIVAAVVIPDPPDVSVNVDCGLDMHLDITYPAAPDTPWSFEVYADGLYVATLVDDDGDLMGYHPVIPAADLPAGDYWWFVVAENGDTVYDYVATGTVECPTPSVTPSPTVTPSPSASVTPSPTGSQEPTGTASPQPSTSSSTYEDDVLAPAAPVILGTPTFTG